MPLFHSLRKCLFCFPVILKHVVSTEVQSTLSSALCLALSKVLETNSKFLTQRVSPQGEGGGGHRCINKAFLASKNKDLLKVAQAKRGAYWKEVGFLRTQGQTAQLGLMGTGN